LARLGQPRAQVLALGPLMPSLLRNVGVNLLGFAGGKLAAALTGILLLRALRPEAAGVYGAALGFAALFQSLADLGLGSCLTREVGRQPRQAQAWFSRGFYAQVAQTALAGAALALFLWLGGARGVEPALVALAFGIPALASLGTPVAAALQGLERFGLQSLASTGASLLNASALGLLLLLGRAEPRWALLASVSAAAVGVLLWAWAAWRGGLALKRCRPAEIAAFWRQSLPFAAVSVSNQLYVRVDQALLAWLLGTGPLGFYVAAVRLVDQLVPLLNALNGPLYARLAQLQGSRRRSARLDAVQKLNQALRYMGALCLPLGVGGSLLAGPLVTALLGADYMPAAAQAFVFLAWVPALIGLHSNLLHGLNAVGLTRRLAQIFAFNLLVNVGLNLWLVPRYGIVASAAVSVLCEAVNLGAAWALARGAELGPSLRRAFWPALPAALGMGALLLWLRVPLQASLGAAAALALVPLGALAYGLLLLAFGFAGPEERALWSRLRSRG
jgi:O-antigen/teichoic acid export membrane protein